MRRFLAVPTALLALAMPPSHASSQTQPTLAVVNARVWTGDPRRPWADAVAAAGDRIVAAGSGAEVRKHATPANRAVDARGTMGVPGFIDSHVHFLAGGLGVALGSSRHQKEQPECGARK